VTLSSSDTTDHTHVSQDSAGTQKVKKIIGILLVKQVGQSIGELI
jgi:hypothetical protein